MSCLWDSFFSSPSIWGTPFVDADRFTLRRKESVKFKLFLPTTLPVPAALDSNWTDQEATHGYGASVR
jgi:hypothetical protein